VIRVGEKKRISSLQNLTSTQGEEKPAEGEKDAFGDLHVQNVRKKKRGGGIRNGVWGGERAGGGSLPRVKKEGTF